MDKSSRKPAILSISSRLLAEAKALNINLSSAAQNSIESAVLEAKAEQWKEDNKAAIESSNALVEKYGLPLDDFRPF